MTAPLYYQYPFGANADDLTAIPMAAAGDGSVSYFAGWTDPYEYDLLTNPAALPIPRGQMNQLFFDITNNIQEYQQYGLPQWITAITYAYPIYAHVYYNNVAYQNNVAANTATPGTDTTWNVIRTSIYVADTSVTPNTVTIPLTPAPAAYYAGLTVDVKVANTNTGASVGNISTLGNKNIVYTTGAPLIGGEMPAGGIAKLEYDGTNLQLLNPVLPSIVSSTIASGSAVSLSSTTSANVTSITLTKGYWMIQGNVGFIAGSGASAVNLYAWCSTTSASATPDESLANLLSTTTALLNSNGFNTPPLFLNLTASSTTVYLSCNANFGGGIFTACGSIKAMKLG